MNYTLGRSRGSNRKTMFKSTRDITSIFLLMVLLQVAKGNEGGLQVQDYSIASDDYIFRMKTYPVVRAIEKGSASLPCDLTPPRSDDRVSLVVWSKDKDKNSIYSYDVRYSSLVQPITWRDKSILHRSFFRTFTQPATLNLDQITEKDEGIYRCRIEYLLSGTKNYWVNLQVIVPPQKATIIDETGKHLSSIAGPYSEGGDMKLKCVVIGGKPPPEVQWLRNGTPLVSQKINNDFQNVPSYLLIRKKLTRSDLQATFTCRASNNNLMSPLEKTVGIEIYFGPISVKILNNKRLSAKKKYEIICQTYGSRPPAKIHWLIDNKEVDSHRFAFNQTNSENGTSSISVLTFYPSREDNGLSLTCRAVNPSLIRSAVEDTVKLNVSYVPQPIITLGPNLKNIKEREDVYFQCEVNANPEWYKLIWKHDNKILQPDKKNGIILSNKDLALQNVTKHQTGNYSCVASNVEGDGESNVFNLKVMYKPICKANQKRVYGVARRETAEIFCEVESYPSPTSFKWSFNNSGENIDIPQTRIHRGSNRFLSTVTYTPINELDYGTVLCWASNTAGKQSEPCVFHIVTAGKPDPPLNCSLLNTSSHSLEVKCMEGFDGGLPQMALLEVFDQFTAVMLANITSTFPSILIEDLEAGKFLKIVIYAFNSRGRSEGFVLEAFTLMGEEKQSVLSMDVQSRLEIVPALGVIVGFVIMLLILSIATLTIIKLRNCKLRKYSSVFSMDSSKTNSSSQKRQNGRDFLEKDENNPDIIPIYTNLQLLSSNNSSQYSTQENIVTPLTEAFLAKNREQELYELHYAELASIRPDCFQQNRCVPTKRKDNQVVYAEIQHDGGTLQRPKQSTAAVIVCPENPSFPSGRRHHLREVVTTKAPFTGYHQESCV